MFLAQFCGIQADPAMSTSRQHWSLEYRGLGITSGQVGGVQLCHDMSCIVGVLQPGLTKSLFHSHTRVRHYLWQHEAHVLAEEKWHKSCYQKWNSVKRILPWRCTEICVITGERQFSSLYLPRISNKTYKYTTYNNLGGCIKAQSALPHVKKKKKTSENKIK